MTEQEFFKRYSFNIRKDKIGGGSFGTVYKAYDNVLDREVAVKVSEVKFSGDKEFSLRQEFKAIEKLPPHANIANYEEVHTFESFQGIFDYAIMQYYPLGNLDSFLSETELSTEQRESIVLSILEGISHLHNHNVVHRDLKPSNILVVDRKGKLIPKITDFGLSKQASSDSKASRFTNSFAGGTLQYCSPEQIKGLPLKLNTDLWSFGVIAYEIFTSSHLFEVEGSTSASAEWQNEISQKILHEEYAEKLENLPGAWQQVVAACFERDMDKRVPSTTHLLGIIAGDKAWSHDQNEEPEQQPNDDATQILTKRSQEEPAPQKNPETENAQPAPKKQRKISKTLLGVAAGLALAVLLAYVFNPMDFITSAEASTNEPVVYKQDSLYGYKLGDSIIIPARYTDAADFTGGRARVTLADSSFYIDSQGEWITAVAEEIHDPETEVEVTEEQPEPEVPEKKEEITDNSSSSSSTSLSLAEQKAQFEKAKKLHNNEEYQKAYDLFLEPARLGYMDAQRFIGHQYFFGYGRSKDHKKAREWYIKAESQGDNTARFNLGVIYEKGYGVSQDYQKAIEFYTLAAKEGYASSQRNLGNMYKYGRGGDKNYKKAIEWFTKAANSGSSDSMNDLGLIYESEESGVQDYEKAFTWYKKAADRGNSWGQKNLGELYFYGRGVDENNEKAYDLFRKSADNGNSSAMAYIGYMHDLGEGRELNWEKAVEWYAKAANNGSSWGKRALGEFYMFGTGGLKQNQSKAEKLFKDAANDGDKKSEVYLEVMSDLANGKYYHLNKSKYGNKFFVSEEEIREEFALSPFTFKNYSDSWFTDLSYELGNAVGVQICAYKPEIKEDNIPYSSFSSCIIIKERSGIRPVSFGWDSYPSGRYDDGTRQIGYMYFHAQFFDENGSKKETLQIKIPAMLCWKPRSFYQN